MRLLFTLALLAGLFWQSYQLEREHWESVRLRGDLFLAQREIDHCSDEISAAKFLTPAPDPDIEGTMRQNLLKNPREQ